MASGSLTGGEFEIDPSLHRYGRIDSTLPIDPALFELEGLVNDVRRGKVRLDEPMEEEQDVMDEHDIDPALREIVNSLTNAQQVCLTVTTQFLALMNSRLLPDKT